MSIHNKFLGVSETQNFLEVLSPRKNNLLTVKEEGMVAPKTPVKFFEKIEKLYIFY